MRTHALRLHVAVLLAGLTGFAAMVAASDREGDDQRRRALGQRSRLTNQAGDTTGTLSHDGLARRYHLHTPRQAGPAAASSWRIRRPSRATGTTAAA